MWSRRWWNLQFPPVLNQNHSHTLRAAALAYGSVHLCDATSRPEQKPVRLFREHTLEVYDIGRNHVRRNAFLSDSWDDTPGLMLWSPTASIHTYRGQESQRLRMVCAPPKSAGKYA
jgi:hypothetical protein